jgi:hypothetical protein
MTKTFASRTIGVRIDRPPGEVYAFASRPENLPRWAAGLGASIENVNGEWVAQRADGPVRVRFADQNAFGILDHWVTTAAGVEVAIPMRVFANGDGSEIAFILFRLPNVSDDAFARDAASVERDLQALKGLLEALSPDRRQGV